jgi:hypothetical protein
MKTVKYLLGICVFAVLMTGCVTTRDTAEDYDEENVTRIGNRVYVDDPYYGRVILERDPFSGRYYDVTNGSRGYSSYNNYYRSYRGYPRYYNNYPRSYNNNNSGNVQRPSQEQIQRNREEARKKVLGNK